MPRVPEARRLAQVREALERALGGPLDLQSEPFSPHRPDLLLRAPDAVFVIEWKPVGDTANVGSAIEQLEFWRANLAKGRYPAVAIVAVPFMGMVGRRLCEQAGVSWIDLSGNAWIDAPGRHIRIQGNPNRFTARGRPANVFAPRSSRIVRALLMSPDRSYTQAELVSLTGVDKARVSRVVRRLEAMELAERDASRAIRLRNPSLALEAWREAYDFTKHQVRRGHAAVRTPEELIQKLANALEAEKIGYALTGLAGAWFLTRFAGFRLVTAYVRQRLPDARLSEIGFRDEPRGANLWLVLPADEGVFEGASPIDSFVCAHPVQVYLDLKAHPERAEEAAAELRRHVLRWID